MAKITGEKLLMKTKTILSRLQDIINCIDPDGNKKNQEAVELVSKLIQDLEIQEKLNECCAKDKSHTERLSKN